MQWEFRKTLETFEGYKRSATFKNQIENGDEGTLDVVLREIELILAEKNEKIVTKGMIQDMQFVRDIMVLGQEDVVKRVEKLIPQLTKICSHELASSDPDRGETYFHDHPAYLKLADEDEKKQIDTLGSTFLILSLESVYHWARWIPLDSTGQQSIYARAYQTLVDRGAKFPSTFHYYKQSDTQKFKNMYKMEFFTDSYDSAYSGLPSEVQNSQSEDKSSKLSIEHNKSFQKDNRSKVNEPPRQGGVVQEYTGETRGLKKVNEIMNYLNKLRGEKGRKMGDLREINKNIQQTYELDSVKKALNKQQKKWIEGYLINFGFLNSSLISYEQFLQRCISQDVQIQHFQQEDISIDQKFSKFPTVKSPNQLKNEHSKISLQSQAEKVQDLLKKQEFQYKSKLNAFLVELQQKSNEIMILKSNAEKQKSKLIEDYQSRILLIKGQVKRGQQDRGAFQKELEKQNERLRTKVANLQQELSTYNYSTARERDLQSQRNQLLTKVKKLQIQNEKLSQLKTAKHNFDKEMNALESTIKEKENALERVRAQLKKSEKQIQNYSDQAGLYKSQLINERNKHDQKINTFTKSNETLENENKQLKQKQLQLRKSLDLKEIETLSLREQLKRYQGKLKDIGERKEELTNNRSEQFVKSRQMQMQSPGKTTNNQVQVYSNQKQLRFNNYEDLYLQLKPNNRQMFIRLCRCGLKKKDILLKDNEMEVGIISELVSQQSLKFILHFTNTSQKQVENLKIDYNLPHSYLSTLDYQIDNKYIFCIQPQQQEKSVIVVSNKQPPFLKERAILELSYDKNGVSYTTNLFLPFLIVKFFDFYRPKPYTLPERARNIRQVIQLKFNRKMLPKPLSIRSYFQQAQETSQNKFEVDGYHRETELSVHIVFQFTLETQSLKLDVLSMKQKANDRQKYVFQELVSFLEAAFKK